MLFVVLCIITVLVTLQSKSLDAYAATSRAKSEAIGIDPHQAGPLLCPGMQRTGDNNTQIVSTSRYPWRATVWLRVTKRDGSLETGTGWFIGPHTVITAGHIVYNFDRGNRRNNGFNQRVEIIPGANGTQPPPFGSVTVSGTNFRVSSGWITNGDKAHDYGAIELPDNTVGLQVGWYSINQLLPISPIFPTKVCLVGYPGNKPAGTQWRSVGYTFYHT